MKPTTSTGKEHKNDPPVVSVEEIKDPTAFSEGVEAFDQDVIQLQSGQLRATRISVRLAQSLAVYHSINLPLRSRSSISVDLIGFIAFGPQAVGTFNGVAVRPNLLLACEPGVAGEFVVEAGFESIAVFLSPAVLRRALEIRQREDEFLFPKGIEFLQSDESAARVLFNWGKRVTATAAQQPGLFDDHPTSRETAHSELMEALLGVLGSTNNYEPTREERTSQNHSRIVQLAEDYATRHAMAQVSVTELCKVTGASERTLQYGFKKTMNMTPIAYLTRLRLHRVRRALRKAPRGSTTVSAEALDWGFWHFGDFSKAYKLCFGETPSKTLNRNRDPD